MAGDSHNSWLSNLYDKKDKFIGIEVGAPAISSPSFGDSFGESTQIIEEAFVKDNRDLVWTNGRYKGYVSMDIHSEYIDVSFNYVSSVKTKDYSVLEPYAFRVEHNKPLI